MFMNRQDQHLLTDPLGGNLNRAEIQRFGDLEERGPTRHGAGVEKPRQRRLRHPHKIGQLADAPALVDDQQEFVLELANVFGDCFEVVKF